MQELRKSIGAIILNKNNEIITFQRVDYEDSWQGVEGGIEENETPIDALYREVQEEIGIEKDQYDIIKEHKEFIPYIFPDDVVKNIGIKGQQKKFYLIKLKNDVKFNFETNPDGCEFKNYKIVSSEEFLKLTPRFKDKMYKKVFEDFGLVRVKIKPERLAKVIARTGYC